MASSALTVLSASDSDAAHRVARRADPTEVLETGPSARRVAAADARRAATRGRAAVATTTGFRVSIAGFMVTTSGVPRTRGASGSDELAAAARASDVAAVSCRPERQVAQRSVPRVKEVPRNVFVERAKRAALPRGDDDARRGPRVRGRHGWLRRHRHGSREQARDAARLDRQRGPRRVRAVFAKRREEASTTRGFEHTSTCAASFVLPRPRRTTRGGAATRTRMAPRRPRERRSRTRRIDGLTSEPPRVARSRNRVRPERSRKSIRRGRESRRAGSSAFSPSRSSRSRESTRRRGRAIRPTRAPAARRQDARRNV